MDAILERILPINIVFTTVVFAVAARLYLVPRLDRLEPRSVLPPILLLHSLRHLGLMFLVPGVVEPGMPRAFAYPAAVGDFVTATLALVSIPAVLQGWPVARPLVWVFSVFGTLDLLAAITVATFTHAPIYMGAAYWIPAFWVPALLVTHYLTFVILREHWQSTVVGNGRVEALGGHA